MVQITADPWTMIYFNRCGYVFFMNVKSCNVDVAPVTLIVVTFGLCKLNFANTVPDLVTLDLIPFF